MRTTFIKDMERDAAVIYIMLSGKDHSGIKNRAKRMGIDKKLLDLISKAKTYEEVKVPIEKLVDEVYEKDAEIIDNAIITYQKAWDKINDDFYNEVERITETKWKFPEYKVVVSPFHPGVSSRGNNVVIRWCWENSEDQKRITAHEILMTHIWHIIDTNYPEVQKDEDDYFWGLNEVTTSLLLGFESSLNKLWANETKGYDKYLLNYPQLKKLKQELKEIYVNKKSFTDYLDQAVTKI